MCNVLLIEDEKDLLEDMPQLLKTYGLDASATSNFEKAAEWVAEGRFDCIILDLKMPPVAWMSDEETENGRTTGLVVCEMLRKADARVPILVVTSVRDADVHSLATKAGANAVLQKPCYPDEIVQKLKLLMRNR